MCGNVGNMFSHDCIAALLQCDSEPAYDNCYCRADFQPTASSYLSSCISKSCANKLDESIALSIHSQYCLQVTQTKPNTPTLTSLEDSTTFAIPAATITIMSTAVETAIIYTSSGSRSSEYCIWLLLSMVSLRDCVGMFSIDQRSLQLIASTTLSSHL